MGDRLLPNDASQSSFILGPVTRAMSDEHRIEGPITSAAHLGHPSTAIHKESLFTGGATPIPENGLDYSVDSQDVFFYPDDVGVAPVRLRAGDYHIFDRPVRGGRFVYPWVTSAARIVVGHKVIVRAPQVPFVKPTGIPYSPLLRLHDFVLPDTVGVETILGAWAVNRDEFAGMSEGDSHWYFTPENPVDLPGISQAGYYPPIAKRPWFSYVYCAFQKPAGGVPEITFKCYDSLVFGGMEATAVFNQGTVGAQRKDGKGDFRLPFLTLTYSVTGTPAALRLTMYVVPGYNIAMT